MIYLLLLIAAIAYFLVGIGYGSRAEEHGVKQWKALIGCVFWPVIV